MVGERRSEVGRRSIGRRSGGKQGAGLATRLVIVFRSFHNHADRAGSVGLIQSRFIKIPTL